MNYSNIVRDVRDKQGILNYEVATLCMKQYDLKDLL